MAPAVGSVRGWRGPTSRSIDPKTAVWIRGRVWVTSAGDSQTRLFGLSPTLPVNRAQRSNTNPDTTLPSESAILVDRMLAALRQAPTELLDDPTIVQWGVAWREGIIRFVVCTESIARVEELRQRLPSRIGDVPVTIEVRS